MNKHALIVEDDINTATALGRVMKLLHFSISVATSLKEARVKISERIPDIVLLDLSLPDGSGLEFMLQMKDTHKSRFVVITGNQSQLAAVESLRADADDFLVKPVSLSDLKNTIARSVGKLEESTQSSAGDTAQNTALDVSKTMDEKAIVDALVGKTFWHLEKDLLLATLDKHNGDKTEAARTLGISLKTLYNRLNAYT